MIILFSGTGNSTLVAKELQKNFGGEIVTLCGSLLTEPAAQLLEVDADEVVLWVMPVYSWGIPPVVANFIKKVKMKCAGEVFHYLVLTCGDDIGFADNQWRQLIGRRGWNPRGTFSVRMPNTYVCLKGFDVDSLDVAERKLAAMPLRVSSIANAISRRFSGSDVVRGSFPWIKSAVVYPFFRRFYMSPHPFKATSDCMSCGLCSRSCPMGNISMSDGHPVWAGKCALCLRCYHICPSHAVAYGTATISKSQKPVTIY